MVNKCVVYGCKSGYKTTKDKISSFHFPFKNQELLKRWKQFVNRANWEPKPSSKIC